MKASWLFSWIAIFAFLPSIVFAELPPEVYEEMQEKAPEVVRISVKRVIASRKGLLDFSGDREMVVFAKVISVTKSDSGVKVGDEIVISYDAEKPDDRIAGPSPIPKLEVGKEYPAWLSKAEAGHYEPAARGFSFTVLK